ncbi:MAG TPA: exonuclease domain-containing protein [Selenomonadales bacterium]|nr:exonuclease domain-containing protein [Selenomonadales bacterium]
MAGYNLFSGDIPKIEADFVTLDFETANRDGASACAIGLAFVKGGAIVANHAWLIRPPKLSFDADFIKLHGITPEAVAGQPELPAIWEHLAKHLKGRLIVAHNAEFDINVLKNSLTHYRIALPALDYSCTMLLAQRVWPSWGKYGLAALAARHGITFAHHDAGEDAAVCAQIALKALGEKRSRTLDELMTTVQLSPGRLHPEEGHSPIVLLRPSQPLLFGSWQPSVHNRADQLVRRQRAESITDAVIHPGTASALINGYQVTLDTCTCPDYLARRLPCKHIYRLAAALSPQQSITG